MMEEENVVDIWFLNAGTYNCVFDIRGSNPPAVCRLTIVPTPDPVLVEETNDPRRKFLASRGDANDEEPSMLYRARFMLTLLTRFDRVLGPSFVRELGQTQIFAGLDPLEDLARVYRVQWGDCEKLKERAEEYEEEGDNYSIVVQKMEKLGGPWTGTSPEQTLALLWFFVTTHRAFRFRHHDLKPHNLLTRNYGESNQFGFQYGETGFWTFEETAIPVVIDLDFATVRETVFSVDRYRVGTYSYAPPDALFREFLLDSKDKNGGVFNFERYLGISREQLRECFYFGLDDQDGYDLWSIGLIILKNLDRTRVRNVVAATINLSMEFAKALKDYYLAEQLRFPEAEYLQYLFINTVISSAILTSFDAQEWSLPNFQDGRYPGGKVLRNTYFKDIMNHKDVRELNRAFHQDAHFNQHRRLIQRLMFWEPVYRGGASLLQDFSKPGEIFHPFVATQQEMKRVRTNRLGHYFKYDPFVMEGTQDPLLSDEERENLKSEI